MQVRMTQKSSWVHLRAFVFLLVVMGFNGVSCFTLPPRVRTNFSTKHTYPNTKFKAHTSNSDCTTGCGSCGQGNCFICYQRPFDGHLQCSKNPAPGNKCKLYSYNQQGCTICEQKYMADIDSSNTCIPIPNHKLIQNCLDTVWSQGLKFCGLCQGGFPAYDYSHCKSFKKGQQAAQNCLVGRYTEGENSCFKCSPGYASQGGVCVFSTVKGCQILKQKGQGAGCLFCDVDNGWFMLKNDGQCVQPSQKSKEQEKVALFA